jgi:hypothetical protein
VGGREWRAVAVIGAFMAAITGSEGGGNYDRLKRGGRYWGVIVGGSMAWEKEGAASMARWCERRRRRSAGVVWEEEMPGGPRGLNRLAGGWAD